MRSAVRPATRGSRRFLMVLAWLVAVVALPSSAQAQWGGEIRMQMGYGGDELASVEYSDGSESSLHLGTYMAFTIGPILEVWSAGSNYLELQPMIGWAGWSTGPENTDDRLKFTRIPVELLAFYSFRMPGSATLFRLGGGATYHLGGGVRGTGSLDGFDMDLDNALGFTGEASAVFGIVSLGLRYTGMDVTIDRLPGTMDGSSLSLFIGLTTSRN